MRSARPTRAVSTTALAIFLGAIAAVALVLLSPREHGSTPNNADQDHVRDLLEKLPQVPRRVHTLGYDRELFGGWQTRVTDQGWRCTSREVVLLRTFTTSSPSSAPISACPKATGSATDVYTNNSMTPSDVHIDHIVPLAAAWDHGAYKWPREKRVAFANDTARNLVAVSSTVNQEKSDGTLAEWLPPAAGSTPCAYVARYLLIVNTYTLSISAADAGAARDACRL